MRLRISHVSVAAACAALALIQASPAQASSNAGTDSRPWPNQVFASDSFWYRKLPADTPVVADSAARIAYLHEQGVNAYGNKWRNLPSMNINTESYSPPLYVARNSDPVVDFAWDNCQGKSWDEPELKRQLSGLHIPADALPANGTDMEMTVYNADTRQYTDTWVTKKINGKWSACWGGTLPDAKASSGVFPWPYGTTGAGLAFAGGVIRANELREGRIDHVLGIALPVQNVNGQVSAPANRTDGSSTEPYALAEGQMLRLPASLNVDALKLSPTAKTVARAAQEYGIVVWDRSGDISFRAENPIGMKSNPYPTLFQGKWGYEVLWGDPARGEEPFPFDQLQVLPMNYQAPLTQPPATQPPSSQTPTGPRRHKPATTRPLRAR